MFFNKNFALYLHLETIIPSAYLASVRILPALFVAFQPSRGRRPLLRNRMGLRVLLRST